MRTRCCPAGVAACRCSRGPDPGLRQNAPVRILLPPSETKRDGALPGPVDVTHLVAPGLGADRTRALRALARYCSRMTPAVRAGIGITGNQDAELLRNAQVLEAPVAAAHEVYDGVLFDALAFGTLPPAQQQCVLDAVLVQSALFGVVGLGDRIPAYRCSADSTLPRLGRMGTFWRSRLGSTMTGLIGDGVLVDMRSGAYASMWTPDAATAARTVVVRVMQERDGRRLAVSHFNKATKGRLVRALCSASDSPSNVREVAEAVGAAGYAVTLLETRGPAVLEVLMPEA